MRLGGTNIRSPWACLLLSLALAAGGVGAGSASAVSGGHPVPERRAPQWLVTIASRGAAPLPERELCGGVLIGPARVVTAAHCLDLSDPTRLELHVGGGTLSRDPGPALPIRGFTTHPGYRLIRSTQAPWDFSRSSAVNDVAIVELSRPVRGVVPLPVAGHPVSPGVPVTVFGHGRTQAPTDADPAYGDAVHRARLRVISDATCNAGLAGMVDGPSVLCAQSSTAMVCAGDSGGPLVVPTRRGPRLVGITSFAGEVVAKACGDGYPNGFADAVALRTWLTQADPTLAPMPSGPAVVTGTKAAGSLLTCRVPSWIQEPASVTYEWARSEKDGDFDFFEPIEGQESETLTLTDDLAGRQILCSITARTAGGAVQLAADPV